MLVDDAFTANMIFWCSPVGSSLQSCPTEDFLGPSEIDDLCASFLGCLFDVILIARGRHFERDESTSFSMSCLESGVLLFLRVTQLSISSSNVALPKETVALLQATTGPNHLDECILPKH